MRPGGVGPPAYRAKPSGQRPSQRAPSRQPSESQRVRGGQPTPSDAGLRPTLSQASSTAPQRPSGYRSRPRPAPPPLGAAALANTSVPRSLVTPAHRPSVPQSHRPSVPQAHGPSVPPPPGLATSVRASGPRGPEQSGSQQTHAHRTTVPFRNAARPNGPSQVSQWVRPRFEPGALTTDPLCIVQWRAGVQNTERVHACARALDGRWTGARAKELERERYGRTASPPQPASERRLVRGRGPL